MVERMHGGQLQALHHMRGALLVLLEMCGLDVALIDLLGGIDLEDANLRGVLGTLHREKADDTRLALYAHAVHLVGKQKYFFYLFDVSVRLQDLFLLVGSVAVANHFACKRYTFLILRRLYRFLLLLPKIRKMHTNLWRFQNLSLFLHHDISITQRTKLCKETFLIKTRRNCTSARMR